jgi:hypothetical protein
VPYETLIRPLVGPNAACGHAAGKEREGASARCVFPRGAVCLSAACAYLRGEEKSAPTPRAGMRPAGEGRALLPGAQACALARRRGARIWIEDCGMKARPFRAGLVWGRYSQGVAPGYRMAPRCGAGVWAIIMQSLVRRHVSERGKTEQVDNGPGVGRNTARRWGCANKAGVSRNVARRRGCANEAGVGRNAARRWGAPTRPALAATRQDGGVAPTRPALAATRQDGGVRQRGRCWPQRGKTERLRQQGRR